MISDLFRYILILLALSAASIPIYRHGLPTAPQGSWTGIRNSSTSHYYIRKSPSPEPSKQQRILLASYVFGEEAVHKKYLQMFVESARTSGLDIALVGNPVPPLDLPPNVRHVNITWDGLLNRISERLFDGKDLKDLRRARPYKVIDYKPLFAFLFPQEVEGYDWWGHVDNDLILGNVGQFLTHEVLTQHDIISGKRDEKTWGPFMLYRNSNVTNELFRLAERPLEEIFASHVERYFDEWGGGVSRQYGKNYNSTMSGIVEHHADRLGLRWYGNVSVIEDCFCKTQGQPKERCSECLYERNANQVRLISGYDNDNYPGQDVALCHYQWGKPNLEESLKDPNTMNQLWKDGAFRVSYPEGFRSFPAKNGTLQQ